MRKLSLLLVDDHPIVCLGVETLLKGTPKIDWLGAVSTGDEALKKVEECQPSLMIVDLMLGGRDGLELITLFRQAAPATRIIVFSALEEKTHALRAFRAGAHGYVMKGAGFEPLLEAIRAVAEGQPFASHPVKQALLELAVGKRPVVPGITPGVERLSNQELRVYLLLGSGLSSAQVAEQLSISPKTVSTHRERIKNKLNFHSARELERNAERFFQQSVSGSAVESLP